jgi:hypothetical protein
MLSRARKFLGRLLVLDDTPERIARAFALGVFLAFSPLIGLHIFLGFGFAFLCGLNRVALFLGLFINNPWTVFPIYVAGTYLGGLLIGFPQMPAMPDIQWQMLWSSAFWGQVAGQWHVLKPMILGSFVLSISLSAMAYFAVFCLIKQSRIRR